MRLFVQQAACCSALQALARSALARNSIYEGKNGIRLIFYSGAVWRGKVDV
jgi:hypothetical protein